jgi:hypothetical protein
LVGASFPKNTETWTKPVFYKWLKKKFGNVLRQFAIPATLGVSPDQVKAATGAGSL